MQRSKAAKVSKRRAGSANRLRVSRLDCFGDAVLACGDAREASGVAAGLRCYPAYPVTRHRRQLPRAQALRDHCNTPGPATRPREGGMVPRGLPPAATALRSPHAERGGPCRATSWASEQCRRSCPGASHRWPMSQDHCSVRCVSFLRRTMCNEQRRARPFKSPAHRSRSSGPTTDRTLAAVPPHTP